MKNNIVAGLKIGRNGVSMVALEREPKTQAVVFVGSSKAAAAEGVRGGCVINLEDVTEAVVKATEDISQKSGRRISSVFVNISGPDIRQQVSHAVIALPQRGCEIAQKNIGDLIESCKIVSVPLERHLLYQLPIEYAIDGQAGVKNPLGLYGNKLEADVMMVTAPFNQVQNIIKAVNFAGLDVEQVVLTAIALSNSTLNPDEKKNGVLLIDLKTDLTEFGVFRDNALLFFDSIPMGQAAIINGIAAKFDIPYELAEDLRKKYAFLGAEDDPRGLEHIPVDWMGKRHSILRNDLNKAMADGLEQIFSGIAEKAKQFKRFNNCVRSGAILHGGTVETEGLLEWAAHKLGFAVKEALPCKELGSFPFQDSMTAAGLALFGLKTKRDAHTPNARFLRSVFQKTGELLADFF
jgi:cell division protein FtsA